jgi:hypothetical protein
MSVIEQDFILQVYTRLRDIIFSSENLKNKFLLLRQLLESVYKKLSEDSNMSFSGLFARMKYIQEQLEIPSEIDYQLNQLRILSNKAAHEDDYQPTSKEWLSSVYAINKFLRWLNPEIEDSVIEDYLSKHQAQAFPPLSPQKRKDLLCIVKSWEILKNNNQDAGLKIVGTLEEGIECTIYLNDMEDAGKKWSTLAKVLWKYCTLKCFRLTPIQGRAQNYQSNPTTLIVLEPDFLIDTSYLAECFTNNEMHPEDYILNRMISEPSSEKQIQGIIVNNILDELIRTPDMPFKELFKKSLIKQPISLVALGNNTVLNIYQNILRIHFPALKEFAASLRNVPVQLELSFFNPDYGLQGRVDILYEKDGKRHIVELKSGRAHIFDVWKNNKMQVIAYNMMLKKSGRNPLGYASIFYSAAGENALRHISSDMALEQELIMCRNRIVGLIHNLAIDPIPFFNWLKEQKVSFDLNFREAKLSKIIETLQNLEDYEYEWFLEQVRLLCREIWFEKTGGLNRNSIFGYNALWQESVNAKKQHYRILTSLKLEKIQFNEIWFSIPDEDIITDFRIGDLVVLYREKMRVEQQEIIRGKIKYIDREKVKVQLNGGCREIEDSKTDLWAMEHDIIESALYAPLSSIFDFLQDKRGKRPLFLGLSEPNAGIFNTSKQNSLDDVVERMFAAKDYFIVQGPPGTGKTSGLLTQYIEKVFRDTEHHILILSFTNRAVDEICLNLKKHSIPFIRTGQSETIKQELLEHLIAEQDFDEIEKIIKSNRIWVATVQSCNAWLNDMLNIVKIDELVIDEASQIIENNILGIITKVGKTILIGDQNQLPPITLQTKETFKFQNQQLKSLCYDYYNKSMMERLFQVCETRGWNHSITMLNEHYRMHNQIASLVQEYYANALIPKLSLQLQDLVPQGNILVDSRLVWIEFPVSEHLYYDSLQVQYIIQILKVFKQYGIVQNYDKDVGIVTPFRAMIQAIYKELPTDLKAITIDTVERFQGSERKNIIISLPLHHANDLSLTEALSSDGKVDRKLNVAITRAQERLIILGCSKLCQKSRHYNNLLHKIQSSGTMINYQELFKL